ncbi:MAG: phenylalanine--tRNA ligase subunit beta, partial [Candidatus Yanofskybacteria bacterium]|nr:phenylalanine--tRNA ligase subunit beta [Candidatus Yanofskybacteria bacterium]
IERTKHLALKQKAQWTRKGTLPAFQVNLQTDLVHRYTAFVVENVRILPSPKWVQERLQSLGVNSINNVVDVTNLVMLELGQPLHAFDYDKIRNHGFSIREAKGGEKVTTLDGQTFSLPQGALVIEDEKRLIDLAGIKGGDVSAIDETTKHVIYQAAVFDPRRIYTTKKALNYRTPASDIYAHGVDWEGTERALERALVLLAELKGKGTLVQKIDIYPRPWQRRAIPFEPAKAHNLLGIQIRESEMIGILKSLGCQVERAKGKYRVIPPSWRHDLEIQEDCTEEVGRIFGFHNIPAQLPAETIAVPERNDALFWQDIIQDTLKEAGFTELYTYSFIGERDRELLNYTSEEKEKLVELENPLSEDAKYLRPTLLDNLLKHAAFSSRLEPAQELCLFETGTVFAQGEKGPEETRMLAALMASHSTSGEELFYSLKGVLDTVFSRIGIPNFWYDDFGQTPDIGGRPSLWREKRSAEVKGGNKEIGFLGEIASRPLVSLKLERNVVAFELNLNELTELATEEREYAPISRYPAAMRDIAVLVPAHTRVAEVMNIIVAAGGKLLMDVDLFDLYEGDKIPKGMKSMAFRLVYQAQDRTLTSEEVDLVHTKITEALLGNPEWEVR